MTTAPQGSVSPELFRPTQPRRAFDEVIKQIRQLVDSGQLKPGDRLPSERVLAEQLSVSRNSLREALRMLEISGVITLRRGTNGGAFIARPTTAAMAAHLTAGLRLADFSLENLTDAMRTMGGNALASAIPKLTADDLDELDRHIARAEALMGEEHRTERVYELTEFYRRLAQATENPILVVLMDALLDILRQVLPMLHTDGHGFAIEARKRLLNDLRRGDSAAARRELDEHLIDLHARWLRDNDPEVIVTTGLFTKEE
ncbi:MAG: FadR family transcriptional regulator [Rhodococcus sp. (in: high G+C Gram-positive bacteria)]|nr:MAG: FadR family transcriptional regulator [Rhodococcus sp. (in: high G+C Gram-positive bacteria)]